MNYLSLNLKVFYIDDGEEYYIFAENEAQARDFYENSGECIDEEQKKELLEDNEATDIRECYTFKEVSADTDEDVEIREDEDLMNIMNRYSTKVKDSVNMITYAKYVILEKELRGKPLQVPMYLAGSIFC